MIFGITHHDKNRHVNKEAFLNLAPARLAGKAVNSLIQQNIALGTSEMNVPTIDDGVGLAIDEIDKDPTLFATVYLDCSNENTVRDCVLDLNWIRFYLNLEH